METYGDRAKMAYRAREAPVVELEGTVYVKGKRVRMDPQD